MALGYSCKKWEKEQQRCIKDKWLSLTEKNIKNHILSYTDPESFAAASKFARPTRDKMSLYYKLSGDYYSLAKTYHFLNEPALCLESMYKYVVYHSEAYKNFDPKAENVMICHDLQVGKDFNRIICAAIIIDEFERVKDEAHFSPIISAFYLSDDDTAKELVSKLPDSYDEQKEVYYIKNRCLKKIFLALLEKDEAAFNNSLKERIATLRKQPAGYITTLDIISLAMIKLAAARGMEYRLNVTEIPLSLINNGCGFDKGKAKVIFY